MPCSSKCAGWLASAVLAFAAGCGHEPADEDPDGETDGPSCVGCDVDCHEDGSCDLACPAGEDCDVQCLDDAECTRVDCVEANTCAIECGDAASCALIDCNGANNCEPTCSGAASCVIDCTNANNCDEPSCLDDATCAVLCTGANNCSFDQCDAQGGGMSCTQDVIVCGQSCPTCGNDACEPFEATACPADCD